MITYKELLIDTFDIITGVLKSENKFWKFTNPFYYPVMVVLILFVLFIVPVLGFMYSGWTAAKNEYFIRYQIYQKDDEFIQKWIESFDYAHREFSRSKGKFKGCSIIVTSPF